MDQLNVVCGAPPTFHLVHLGVEYSARQKCILSFGGDCKLSAFMIQRDEERCFYWGGGGLGLKNLHSSKILTIQDEFRHFSILSSPCTFQDINHAGWTSVSWPLSRNDSLLQAGMAYRFADISVKPIYLDFLKYRLSVSVKFRTDKISAIGYRLWPNIGSKYRLYFGDFSPIYR